MTAILGGVADFYPEFDRLRQSAKDCQIDMREDHLAGEYFGTKPFAVPAIKIRTALTLRQSQPQGRPPRTIRT